MKTIRIRFKQAGMHTHMRVFVGETGKTLGKAGDLVMRADEANAFFAALQVGPNGPIGSDMPVEIGLDSEPEWSAPSPDGFRARVTEPVPFDHAEQIRKEATERGEKWADHD